MSFAVAGPEQDAHYQEESRHYTRVRVPQEGWVLGQLSDARDRHQPPASDTLLQVL